MQALIDHGFRLADEIFTSHNMKALAPYLRDITRGESPAFEAGKTVLAGAVARFALLLESAERAGVKITPRPPTPGELAYKAAASPAEFWNAADGILLTVGELFRMVPGIGLVPAAPAPAVKAEPSPPQQINVRIEMPAGPLPVTVETLPDRITETAITRNDAGEIVSSTQIERDRAAA